MKSKCTIEGCDRPLVARGWCGTHYKQNHDRGPCVAVACLRPAKMANLCYAHYNRVRRGGSIDDPTPIQDRNTKGTGGLRNGYRCVTVDGSSVYEHRVVMEQMIGRPLLPFENVHHRNGQRADNRPENLELWTKKQPYGQRVSELVNFVATHYADEVLQVIGERATP